MFLSTQQKTLEVNTRANIFTHFYSNINSCSATYFLLPVLPKQGNLKWHFTEGNIAIFYPTPHGYLQHGLSCLCLEPAQSHVLQKQLVT